jgi:hypothetical protein
MTLSSREWLTENSLEARQLRIADVLRETAIVREGVYVPIIEKTVYAKVDSTLSVSVFPFFSLHLPSYVLHLNHLTAMPHPALLSGL